MSDPEVRAVVAPEQAGKTVAAVLRSMLEGMSWNQVRALVQRGRVQYGDEVATDPAARVEAGQTLVVLAKAAPKHRDAPIQFLHVDADVVVVDKPAGLVSVPFDANERDTLLHRTHAALRRREHARHLPPLRVVQRLDKDTSGVLIFARTRRAERGLGEQFRRHDVQRAYLGLAYGKVRSQSHETWLVPDRGDRRRGSWNERRGKGSRPASARRAVTHVKLLEHHPATSLEWEEGGTSSGVSLVECRLETGRQHQIRIHLGEDHHPLVGERVYDRDYDGPCLRAFAKGRGRPMLHAAELGVQHPTRDRTLSFTADLPSDFADLLRALRADSAG